MSLLLLADRTIKYHAKQFYPILEVAHSRQHMSGGFEKSGIAWKVGTIGGWMARLWVAGAV